MQRLGEPAIGTREVAPHTMPSRVHGAQQGLRLGVGLSSRNLQIPLRPFTIFRNPASIQISLPIGHQSIFKGGCGSRRRRFRSNFLRHHTRSFLPLRLRGFRSARLCRLGRRRLCRSFGQAGILTRLRGWFRRFRRRRGRRSVRCRSFTRSRWCRISTRGLSFGRRRIRRRLHRYDRRWSARLSCRSGRSRWCGVRRRFLNQPCPGIAIPLPVPRQQCRADDQQKQREVQSPVAARRFVLQQIIQIAGVFVPQPQKRRTAYRHSCPFPCRLGRHRRGCRAQRSSTHTAKAVLWIILLAALNTSHCHGSGHKYSNSDAISG